MISCVCTHTHSLAFSVPDLRKKKNSRQSAEVLISFNFVNIIYTYYIISTTFRKILHLKISNRYLLQFVRQLRGHVNQNMFDVFFTSVHIHVLILTL